MANTKLPKMKFSVVLALCLLLASCLQSNNCSLCGNLPVPLCFAAILSPVLYVEAGGDNSNALPTTPDILPLSMSDLGQLKFWVAESASDGPLSAFQVNSLIATTAAPVNILSGVHAGGITSYIGPTPQQSALYLWTNSNNATVEVLDDQDGSVITSIPLGAQGVIQDFAVAPNGKFGYANGHGQ